MNKDIAMKWADALESGKYKQGHNWLRHKGHFCCLGVLCDLSNLSEFKNGCSYNGDPYLGSHTLVPIEVGVWAGLRSPDGRLLKFSTTLTKLNDSGVPFDSIAKIIRDNWELL
jgi:hypothetical protein